MLNVDIWSFFGRVRAGAWPKPGTAIGRGKRLYYGLDQIDELRQLIDGRARLRRGGGERVPKHLVGASGYYYAVTVFSPSVAETIWNVEI